MDSDKNSTKDMFSFTRPSLVITSSETSHREENSPLLELIREKILEISFEKVFYQSKEIEIAHGPHKVESQEPTSLEVKLIYEDLRAHLLKIEQEEKVPFHLMRSIREIITFFELTERRIISYFDEVDSPGKEFPAFLVPNFYLFMSFLNNSGVTGNKVSGLINTTALVEFTQLDDKVMDNYILSKNFRELTNKIHSWLYNEGVRSQAFASPALILECEEELAELYSKLHEALLGEEGEDSPLYPYLKLLERSVDPEKEALDFLVAQGSRPYSRFEPKDLYRTPMSISSLAGLGEYIGPYPYRPKNGNDTLKGDLAYAILLPYKRALEGILIYKKILENYRQELEAFPGIELSAIKTKKPYSKGTRKEILGPLFYSLRDLIEAYEAYKKGNGEVLRGEAPF